MEKEVYDKYRKAGKIAAKARSKGEKLVRKRLGLVEVAEKVEEEIRRKGGKPACPVTISVNAIAAHYAPEKKEEVFNENDVVKLDLTAHVDGYIADTAVTIDLSKKHKDLVKASQEALKEAIKTIKPGVNVKEVGGIIKDKINEFGFNPIANLTGHRVTRYNLHSGLTVPNVPSGDTVFEEDMVVAVEPFATNGAGWVIDTREHNIYKFLANKPMRMKEARDILQYIKDNFDNLPFTKRWIKTYSPLRVSFAINNLLKANALYKYPVLRERENGLVSQAEHTVIVKPGKSEVITK